MQKIVLIPAYEPDKKLIRLILELKKEEVQIIVCNDGSNFTYNSIFDQIKKDVILLSYPINQGKGYAIKYALHYIQSHIKEECIIVTMDSDGQHTIKDAKKLLSHVEQHPEELVLGKRIRKENTPIRSKLGNAITRFIYKLVSGIDVYDTQTGLRAFHKNLIPFLMNVKGNRYEYEMNMLLNAPKNKIKITEIEIETIYIENNKSSHFHTLKDSYRIYKEILRFSLSSMISFCIDYSLFLISHLFFSVTLSNIFARIISSISNFIFNKKIVFQSKNNLFKEAIPYFLLVIFILVINTLLLNLFIQFGMSSLLSKLLVEILLFFVSWFFQKQFIFERSIS